MRKSGSQWIGDIDGATEIQRAVLSELRGQEVEIGALDACLRYCRWCPNEVDKAVTVLLGG